MKATPTAPAWCWPGRLCWFVLYGPLATHSYGRSSSSRVLAVCQTRVLARGRDGRASAENLRERDDAVVLGARRAVRKTTLETKGLGVLYLEVQLGQLPSSTLKLKLWGRKPLGSGVLSPGLAL